MYTIDASVWVNGFDQREKGYEHSYKLLETIRQKNILIFVPNLVLSEISGAISRTRQNPTQAITFVSALSKLPNVRLIPLDTSIAEYAFKLAAQHGLRGADSVYAAVAKEYNCTLISLDNEHLTTLTSIIAVQTPNAVLKGLAKTLRIKD